MRQEVWQAEYAKCKQFAEERGWVIDKHYICQGDLVVGIRDDRPVMLKPCFSYPNRSGKTLDELLAWVERQLRNG